MIQRASFRYVSPEISGAEELDANGAWMPGTEYGAIWFPSSVPDGWAPYRYGHWVHHDPWGWVWVEDEPWGYAPFHYGRWVNYYGRWGWVPGPPASHPVWSPALVVFAGGLHFSIGGLHVSAWFPLGPGEPYRPPYRCSPRYLDQINISNIQPAPRVQVQNTYVNVTKVTNITYVNQTNITVVNENDMASGRSVHQNTVAVKPEQIRNIQVIATPTVQAPAHPVIAQAPARAVPVSAARPAVINASGKLVTGAPGAKPVEVPVKAAPPIKPLPGRTVVAAPPARPAAPAAKPGAPAAKPGPPVPASAVQSAKPAAPATQPAAKPGAPVPAPLAQTARPVPTPAAQPAPKPMAPAAQPAPKPAAPAAQPAPKPAAPPAQPAPKPVPPAAQPAPRPAAPAAQPAPKPAAPPAAKPAPKPEEKPAPKPADKKKDEKKTGN
jgi:hypothetical protein